jgi:hypothetical protein
METPPGKDPKWISDRATYAQPHQYATGYNYVIVNGQIVGVQLAGEIQHEIHLVAHPLACLPIDRTTRQHE